VRTKKILRKKVIELSNKIFGSSFTHRSKLAKSLNELFHISSEILSPTRRRQARFERLNPEAPWFVPDSLPYIESILKPTFVGLEWGTGRSSIWFGKRVAHITCVEGRRTWWNEMVSRVGQERLETRIDLRLVEITSEFNFNNNEIDRYTGVIEEFPDESLDFVIIDGHFREACLDRCSKKIKGGGVLILDNSDLHVFDSYHRALKNVEYYNFTNGIWETTIFHAPNNGGFKGLF